ncbi:hypothetical protein C8R45DRAFT_79034 [Mycena sanguinolenta]|nr:hypothetical protein C8R45DRAFT_79034 [Mycena sanguinolenta]
MSDCPPTPVVKRRAERRASRPYMRFNTDFRSLPEETNEYATENPAEITPTPKYPSFRRAVSAEISNTPKASKLAGYMRFPAIEMSSPSRPDLYSPFSTPKARFRPQTAFPSRRPGRVGESAHTRSPDKENHMSSSSPDPILSQTCVPLASPSTVPIYYRMASIEEDDELEDEGDGGPPITSSPDRSSDPFFLSHDLLSSPRTSDHDSDSPNSCVLQSEVPLEKPANSAASDDVAFAAKLDLLLAAAARQRERHEEIDNAIAATIEDRSLSVTPDYRASPTPRYGEDVFGPRIARTTYSWSSSSADSASFERERQEEIDNAIAATIEDRSLSVTPDYRASPTPRYDVFGPRIARRIYSWSSSSADSASLNSCDSSRSASRTESAASRSGYAGDLEGSPAMAPQRPSFSDALSKFRSNTATPTQRLIAISANSLAPSKRSYSSLHDDYTTPDRPPKKSKLISRRFSVAARSMGETSVNVSLSRIPASVRKSLSLRSDASQQSLSLPYDDFFSTEPNTPTPTTPRSFVPPALRDIPFGVPIIAPPPEHIARLPLSEETSAKIRIGNYLAREEICRAEDNLDEVSDSVSAAVSAMEEGVDVDERRRESRLMWEHILGIGPELRGEIIHWILDVLPEKSLYLPAPIKYASHRLSASSRSSSFSSVQDFGDKRLPDLIDQLLYSPETRFHAAYMFIRYWYLMMGDRKTKLKLTSMREAAAAAEGNDLPDDPSIPSEGWLLVVWDSCLACLAISVKLHRDGLAPLKSVLSREFEALAPHRLYFDDLETAQRDVLGLLDFRLGGTPQPILDELWIALPSLRQLLEFENGWKFAQKEAWWRLFDAVAEPDVVEFPISVLTVAALAEALVAALVSKYKYGATVDSQVIRRRPNDREKLESRAETEMEGALQDIQAMIGISDHTLGACRKWIRSSSED